ncbi:MAG: autotransporter assembly complex protein TamA [Alphaproteobacteria bacterium]|nr:autotransporter assembly complex protein TamA [Alphaproteobacteria bacterium]
MSRLPSPYRIARILTMMLSGGLLVAGCSLTDILTGKVTTNYQLAGTKADPETEAYLDKLLEERLADKTRTLTDEEEDSTERTRQEDYIEQTILADLQKGLQSRGYYKSDVAFIDGEGPLSGQYHITYGPQYFIESLTVRPAHFKPPVPDLTAQVLDAQIVLTAQDSLYKQVQQDRCYFSLNVRNEVILNNDKHTAAVAFVVDAGQEGNFGTVTFMGNENVKKSYLRKLLPWKDGDCFRREKIEDYKTKLLQSGLFARAEAVLPAAPGPDGQVPVTIDLRERARRTITAGMTYYTDEGPGVQFGWEHRNLFGAAEKLTADLELSMIKQLLGFEFTKPYFLRPDQSLSLTTAVQRQETDAFDEMGFKAGAALKRSFNKSLTGSTGIDLNISRIDDKTDNTTNTYGLISLPQTLTYDTRDDTLDPHRGFNITAAVEPFFDILGQSDPFFRTQLTGSTYFAFGTSADLVLATRAGIGSIWGADTDDVPATKRFYAGGGGSVRGYGFQEVGPQNNGEPSGGSSLVNMSLELRGRITDKFGAVTFVDAASVSEDPTPRFTDMAIGAGVGVRYYTDFGPIRFDIATPLTQKDDLEQNYQFYISIGQAF